MARESQSSKEAEDRRRLCDQAAKRLNLFEGAVVMLEDELETAKRERDNNAKSAEDAEIRFVVANIIADVVDKRSEEAIELQRLSTGQLYP